VIQSQFILPDDPIVVARKAFLKRVQGVIRESFGLQYTLEVFGSTTYGVSGIDSDIDVSVVSYN
jgi:DNA polymerase sigma